MLGAAAKNTGPNHRDRHGAEGEKEVGLILRQKKKMNHATDKKSEC